MDKVGGCLTGARLLFGYVDGMNQDEQDQCARDLGVVPPKLKDSDAARLAGRISINAAVEVCANDSLGELDDRFIGKNGFSLGELDHPEYAIPLKILGQPKASAVEHYIRQPVRRMKTYGDLPGVDGDDSAGDLSGRKFYRHQKRAREEHSLFADYSNENINNDQSALARFVSKPDTKFRFTLRFKDLHSWELGAVILALAPQYKDEKCANKLGHGRPLGLGSVRIDVCETWLVNQEGALERHDEQREDCIDAFETVVNEMGLGSQLATWLEVLNYDDSVEAAYPNSEGHISCLTIVFIFLDLIWLILARST